MLVPPIQAGSTSDRHRRPTCGSSLDSKENSTEKPAATTASPARNILLSCSCRESLAGLLAGLPPVPTLSPETVKTDQQERQDHHPRLDVASGRPPGSQPYPKRERHYRGRHAKRTASPVALSFSSRLISRSPRNERLASPCVLREAPSLLQQARARPGRAHLDQFAPTFGMVSAVRVGHQAW